LLLDGYGVLLQSFDCGALFHFHIDLPPPRSSLLTISAPV
jgi:hypothetical protein